MATSQSHRGFKYEPESGRLAIYYNGTRRLNITGSGAAVENGSFTVNTSITATTGAITATAGNLVATAGDLRVTAGNARLGAVSAFGTTEPTSAVVMKEGTAAAGAIATSSGIFATATVLNKIIADGTVSAVET